LFRQALESRQKARESDPVNLAVALADLAMVYKYQGKFGEAEKLLRQGLAILEEKLSPDDPMLTSVLSPLCATQTAEGKYRQALTLTERTRQILRKDPRVADPDLLNTMSTLGMLYSVTGRFTEAEFYAKEAATKAEAIYGTDHPRFGWHLANYAAVLKRMGRKADARAMELRSSAILARSGSGRASQHTVNVNALR
jgi:tetratricopeptide (TPR) repeat protein